MASVENYFGSKAGVVWKALRDNGPMTVAAIKRRTKLSDAELYGGLGWLAREGKLHITGETPLLFKYSVT